MLTEDHRKRIVRAGQQCELALRERDAAVRAGNQIKQDAAQRSAQLWSRIAFTLAAA